MTFKICPNLGYIDATIFEVQLYQFVSLERVEDKNRTDSCRATCKRHNYMICSSIDTFRLAEVLLQTPIKKCKANLAKIDFKKSMV